MCVTLCVRLFFLPPTRTFTHSHTHIHTYIQPASQDNIELHAKELGLNELTNEQLQARYDQFIPTDEPSYHRYGSIVC
jgi:hypothetical protein